MTLPGMLEMVYVYKEPRLDKKRLLADEIYDLALHNGAHVIVKN